MKKIFSMFLILTMILPLLPANATENSCLIEFSGAAAEYSISGTEAFVGSGTAAEADVMTKNDESGWLLSTATGYNETLYINLAESFVNGISENQDVEITVRYYDGDDPDAVNYFCVYYDSKNHKQENAGGRIKLSGSGQWKYGG